MLKRPRRLFTQLGRWLTNSPEQHDDKPLNAFKRVGIILAVCTPVVALLSWMAGFRGLSSAQTAATSAETTSVETTSVETTAEVGDVAPPERTSNIAADELLEVVEVEFGDEPVLVEVNLPDLKEQEQVFGESEGLDEPTKRRPLVITLRNTTDSPAVLTSVKVAVHQVEQLPLCIFDVGGSIEPNYNYEFSFPYEPLPWEGIGSQNFEIPPQKTEALSVTIGPETEGFFTLPIWSFSLWGEPATGEPVLWVDGIGTTSFEFDADEAAQSILDFNGTRSEEGDERIQECAQDALETIEGFGTSSPNPDVPYLVDPMYEQYKRLYIRLQELAK